VHEGLGFGIAVLKGSESNDAYAMSNGNVVTQTDNMGGIQGGLSNGMPITMKIAIKPTPSISKMQKTVNLSTMEDAALTVNGRHDPCVLPRAVPIVEAMAAITLLDLFLIKS